MVMMLDYGWYREHEMFSMRGKFMVTSVIVVLVAGLYVALGGFSGAAEGRSGTWPVTVEYQVGGFTLDGDAYTQTWLFEGNSWSDWTVTLVEVEGEPDNGLEVGYYKQMVPDGYELEGGMEEFEGARVDLGPGEQSAPDGLLNPRSSHPDLGSASADAYRNGRELEQAGLSAAHRRLDIAEGDVEGLVSRRRVTCAQAEAVDCAGGVAEHELRSVTHKPTGIPLFVERRTNGDLSEWLRVVDLQFTGME
jgi:hypothetical protein